jgi:hypothetical protein
MRPFPLCHVLILPSGIGAVRAALYVHVRDLHRRIDLDRMINTPGMSPARPSRLEHLRPKLWLVTWKTP